MSGVNVAIVGVGWVARTIWIPLLHEAGFNIRSLIDPQVSCLTDAGSMCPAAEQHVALTESALSGSDVVFICSPNVMHVDQATFVMALGLDVIIEKPACFSRCEAQRILDASLRSGARFWVSSAATEREDVRYLQGLVERGEISDIKCIELTWLRSQGVPRAGTWFTDKSKAIGGCGADLGWHLLDVGLGLLGYPDIAGAHSSFVYASGESVKSADWFGVTSRNKEDAANMSVELQLYSNLYTENHQIRLSTAWASQQQTDTTAIKIYAANGEASLMCTFGFSPHGFRGSYLKILRQGREERVQILHEEKISPYARFVERFRREREDRSISGDVERQRLLSLSSAMGSIYGAEV